MGCTNNEVLFLCCRNSKLLHLHRKAGSWCWLVLPPAPDAAECAFPRNMGTKPMCPARETAGLGKWSSLWAASSLSIWTQHFTDINCCSTSSAFTSYWTQLCVSYQSISASKASAVVPILHLHRPAVITGCQKHLVKCSAHRRALAKEDFKRTTKGFLP